MKNLRLSLSAIIMAIVVSTLLISCGTSTPKGDDSDVKKLVKKIATKEFRKALVPAIYQQVTNIPLGVIGKTVTYESLSLNRNDKTNDKVLDLVEDKMDELTLSLENIRDTGSNDKIKKSSSAATLVMNGKSIPITYTSQINSDGDLYVLVYGL